MATANSAYTKITNTDLNVSKVLEGLSSVIPPTFRVIKGTLDLVDVLVGGSATLLGTDENPILLVPGEQIIVASLISTTDVASAGVLTLTVGTSDVQGGAGVTADTDIFTALSIAQLNGGAAIPNSLLRLVPDGEAYVIGEVGVAIATAGIVEVTLIVV